ncbi:DP-EP family protein [Colwelliaceae bacterium 6471]
MSEHHIKNHIKLFLKINQNNDNSYTYQYLCRMANGVEVNLQGLVISEPTQITVELTNLTQAGYKITECLIPCDQNTVTAQIEQASGQQIVTLIDRDNEREPEDYNFIIIAQNRHTHEQIVCDPQVHNKGKL